MAVFNNELPLFLFLLEAAKAVNILHRPDKAGDSLLFSALELTGYNCRNSLDFRECTDCSCSDSLAILLGASWVFAFGLDDSRASDSFGPFRNAKDQFPSAMGWKVFFNHLKVQRAQLGKIADRNKWAVPEEALEPLQNAQVLDLHAMKIYKSLQNNHVGVPVDIFLTYQSRLDEAKYPTVYHFIPENAQVAEMALRMGFHDIDHDIKHGRPPLACAYAYCTNGLHYIYWLIQRGANLQRRISPLREGDDRLKTHGIFSAHCVMYRLGQSCFGIQLTSEHANVFTLIATRILPLCLTDSCFCACSVEGCTPFVYMFKGWFDFWPLTEPEKFARLDFTSIFQGLSTATIDSLYLTAARVACFRTLGLTHTCCNASAIVEHGWPHKDKDHDDVEEIRQEESTLLKVLEEMVEEFANRTANLTGDLARLHDCWEEYWIDYVPIVLQRMSYGRMTEEERRDAEMIGVVWKTETEDDRASGRKREEDAAEAAIRHCFRELDLVA